MATKATFTLDDDTLRTIRRLSERARKPQSLIVREAVAHYAAREDTLSDDERERLLGLIDGFAARPATPGDRTAQDVDGELEELRRARRSGGRLHPVE